MAYRDTILADNPVYYLELEESSGNPANSGSGAVSVNVGAGVTRPVTGKVGNAASFGGTNTSFISGNVATTTYTDRVFTIGMWIKTTSTADRKACRVVGSTHFVEIWTTAAGKAQAQVQGNAFAVITGTTTINDGNWHHVALVMNGNTSRTLYVDGVSNGTSTTSISTLTINNVTYAGSNDNYGFLGDIDEFAVFDSALSATRIAAHANPGTSITVDADTATASTTAQDVTIETVLFADVSVGTATATIQTVEPTVSARATVFPASVDASISNTGAITGTTSPINMTGSDRTVHIKFDIAALPTNVTVNSAKMRVYVDSTNLSADDTLLKRNTSAFTETLATRPSTTTTGQKTLNWSSNVITTPGYQEVDITDYVNLWKSGTANHGVTLSFLGGGGDTVSIGSRESSTPPELEVLYTAAAVNVDVPLATATATANVYAATTSSGMSIGLTTVTATAQAFDVSFAAQARVDIATATTSATANEATAEASVSPDAMNDVATALATSTAHDAAVSIPVVLDMSTPTEALTAHDVTVEMTQGVVIELDTPSVTIERIRLTDVNGEPIQQTETEDPYFNSTMRTVDPAGTTAPEDLWLRLNERSGTDVINRVNGQVAARYNNVTIGMNEAPEGRHSVFFNGNASIDQIEPTAQNTDEEFRAPVSMEFTIRTERKTQFIMGGADYRTPLLSGGSVTPNGASEFWMVDGKVNYRAYRMPSISYQGTDLQTNITGFTDIADGKWHHIVVNSGASAVLRGRSNIFEIYIDGKLEIRRVAGVQGTSANETTETGNITFGFPDQIGARGNNFDGYSVPDLAVANWFLGDMTEVIYRNAHTLSNDAILMQRDNMFGIRPVYVDTPRITSTSHEATAKGNQIRVLAIDFGLPSGLVVTSPPKGNHDWQRLPTEPVPTGAFFNFPGVMHRGGVDEAGTGPLSSEDIEGYQFFSVQVRNNYLDPVTDNERVLDLDIDLNMDDYDILTIVDYPLNDQAWSIFDGMDEYNTPPYIKGRDQVAGLMEQIKGQVVSGKRLFINDPGSAVALGIIDRVEFVPAMTERAILNQSAGARTGLYDYRSALIDPWLNNSGSTAMAAANADRYNDTHKNNRQRVRALVPGLTDVPSWIATDGLEWANLDPMGNPPRRVSYRWEPRESGLLLGDEFYMEGSSGVSLHDQQLAVWGQGSSRLLGWPAAPIANVKAGTVVTSFGSTVHNKDRVESNTYGDYAVSIAVEPGDVLGGTVIAGKIYCNFTEEFTWWAPYREFQDRMVLPEGNAHMIGSGAIPLTSEYRYWQYSEHWGTWTGSEIKVNSVDSVWVTDGQGRRFKKMSGVNAGVSSGYWNYTFKAYFNLEPIEVPSMSNRGWRWLLSDAATAGSAVVGVATANVISQAAEPTTSASRSAVVELSTARVQAEAVNLADVQYADVSVLLTTPAVMVNVGAFREVLDLDTASITVRAHEDMDDIFSTADLLVMTMPTHNLILYMEET